MALRRSTKEEGYARPDQRPLGRYIKSNDEPWRKMTAQVALPSYQLLNGDIEDQACVTMITQTGM